MLVDKEKSVDNELLGALIEKATKAACAPLHKEIAALKKASADVKAASTRNSPSRHNRKGRKKQKGGHEDKRSVSFADESPNSKRKKGILKNGKDKRHGRK